MWHYLLKHPDLYAAALKEPHYFVHPEWRLGGPEKDHFTAALGQFIRGERTSAWGGLVNSERTYENLFAKIMHGKFRVEATPNYFHSEFAPNRIINACGKDTKVIVVLRDPVARTLSHYRFFRKLGWEREQFREAISLARDRVYVKGWAPTWDYLRYSQIQHPYLIWKHVFGNNMIAVSFDSLVNKPRLTLKEIFKWLGLMSPWYFRFKKTNATDASKHITADEAEKSIREQGVVDVDLEKSFLWSLFDGKKKNTAV